MHPKDSTLNERQTMLIPREKDHARRRDAPDAASLAIEALGFLAADEDRLGDFLALSGLTVDGLRAAASKPAFLVAVLEHILQDEATVLAFAAAAGVHPADIAPACRQLMLDAGMRPPEE